MGEFHNDNIFPLLHVLWAHILGGRISRLFLSTYEIAGTANLYMIIDLFLIIGAASSNSKHTEAITSQFMVELACSSFTERAHLYQWIGNVCRL